MMLCPLLAKYMTIFKKKCLNNLFFIRVVFKLNYELLSTRSTLRKAEIGMIKISENI